LCSGSHEAEQIDLDFGATANTNHTDACSHCKCAKCNLKAWCADEFQDDVVGSVVTNVFRKDDLVGSKRSDLCVS